MSKTIYVGNLPYNSTEEDLRTLFARYGTVESARVMTDKETGRSRGFGFVDMADEDAAEAIQGLDGSSFSGRTLRVNEAKPRTERGDRGGDRGDRGDRRPPRRRDDRY